MKKILSIFVVICMMMTLAPVASFAQAVEFQLKPAQVTYEAATGETISVPFLMVPNTTVETQVVGFYINIPDGLTVKSVTGGKIPVSSSNGVNVANGKVNVLYDSLITLSPSDATLFTLNCVATTPGTYTLDTVIDGIYDGDFELMGDSSNVDTTDATLTFSASTVTFESKSTLMKKQTFDNGEFSDGQSIPQSKYPSESNVIVEGIQESGYTTKTVNVDGDLAFYIERNVSTNSTSNTFVPWHANVETQSDYIVAQFNYKTNSQNNDMHFRFWYDDLVGGEMVPDSELGGSAPRIDTWSNGGLPLIFKYNSICRDTPFGGESGMGQKGNDNFKWLTENKYQDGNWHKYTFIVDARGFKAYLFIDDEYIMSFTIVRDRSESNYNTDTSTNRYIEGVQLFQFKNGKYNNAVDGTKVKKTWVDDLEVRKMSTEQLQQILASDIAVPDELSEIDGDKLPVITNSYKMPISWSADNSAVSIGSDGSVSLQGISTAENVTFTASVMGAEKTFVATVEGKPEEIDPNASAIIKNSTLVKKQNFDSGAFTAGGEITSATEGVTAFTGQSNLSAKTEQVSDGNLALKITRKTSDTSTWTYRATWNADVAIDRPYFVIAYKTKTNSKADAVDIRFHYDNLTNGELVPDSDKGTYTDSEDKAGLPLYFKYNKIERDSPHNGESSVGAQGCTNFKWLTENQYLNDWHEYSYLIDAINRKAYLYIDGNYVMSFVIVYNRSSYEADAGKFIEGLSRIQIYNTKWDGAYNGASSKETYIDDLQVRAMSDEQFATFMTGEVEFTADVVNNGAQLPTATKTFKFPVTWTTDNANVKVSADGTVNATSPANGETVTFTAKVNGIAIATFSATIHIPNKIDTVLYEPFDYTVDQPISQADAKANGWSIDNESSTSGKGNNPYVKADPADSQNKVLDIEVLTNKDTSKNKYTTLAGAYSTNGHKYIMVSKKLRTSAYANRYIFYLNGNLADATTGEQTNTGTTLLQLTYEMNNKKFGHEQNYGYSKQTYVNFTAADGSFIPTNDWVDMKFIIDCNAHTYNIYMNDVKVNAEPLVLFNKFDGKVITGISKVQFGPNRWDGTSAHLYIDDLTITAFGDAGCADLDAEVLNIATTVESDFDLPLVGMYGSAISWASDNSNVISISDGKAIVKGASDVTTVTLTATITNGSETITKTFAVSVTGDEARINGIANKLTTYVFSGQKYVMESFVPNIPGLAGTDTVSITSSDASIAYNASTNKVTVTKGSEDKFVDVTVKITSAKGNSVTKTLEFYVPSDSVVSHYEGFDYPSIKGSNISSTDAWSVWNEDTNLSTTGIAYLVEQSLDDATDLNMDMNIIRKRDTSKYGNQYAEWNGNAAVAGDAILQANVKFSNTAGNQVVWYVTGNVKTSSGESKKEIASLYIERGSNTLKCEVNGGNSTTTISTTALPTNEWFNLKFVIHTADNSYDIYVDNVKINSSAIPFKNVTENGVVTSITKLVVGASRWNIAAGHIYIDDIMVRSTTADILSTEAKMLAVPETFIYDYTMPTVGIYEGTTIEWKSNNEAVLSKDGKVNREIGLGDTTVTLTATIQSGDAKYEKTFDVKVVKTPYYTIDALVFETADGNTAYSAVPGGKLKYVSVTKYTTSQSDNATAFVAVYDSVGDLCAVAQPQKVNASGNIELDIELPNEEGLYAKAFIWSGNNLAPLAYSYSTKVSDNAVIYTIGDSTMQTYGTIENRQSDNKMTGWVQVLPLALQGDDLTIENKAVAGTSTLSFTDKGYIYPIYEDIKPGDYLLIQFGHNDEKPWLSEDAQINYSPLEGDHNNHPNANPVPDMFKDRKTYEQWLRDYAAAARMRGAQVIFATSIYRRAFNGDEVSYNHYGYPEAMIDTANELNVPVIDLHARSGEWLQQNGADGSQKYYMSFHGGTDNTHLTYDGAVEIANMAISEMKRLVLPVAQAFTSVPKR